MHFLYQQLEDRLRQGIAAALGHEYHDADPLLSPAQNAKFGDLQANGVMALAKRLGRSPREAAEQVLSRLELESLCDRVEIAGPGFLNLTLRVDVIEVALAEIVSDDRLAVRVTSTPQAVVVDYSSPNVAKEMHVGHLRSTVIGDAIARVHAFCGHRVIRQNHLGDWGTQFGMLIEYLLESGKGSEQISDLNSFYQQAKRRDDQDPEFAERARRRVVALQSGDVDTLALWQRLISLSQKHFNRLYQRLDVTLSEGDVRAESFYNDRLMQVVEELIAAGLAQVSDGAVCVFVPGFESKEGDPVPLIVRKSDGGFGYAATDLAAIAYRTRELGAQRIVYVVDARQQDHFKQVFWVAEQMGWLKGTTGASAEHVRFGTILGEDRKPFKTRDGGTVRLVDLLDEAEKRAEAIIAEKNPDLEISERTQVAHDVGIGAVKYADLSGDRIKDYVFSWDRMLAMEGNTAPYLQYAYARTQSIFRKADADVSQLRAKPSMRIETSAERALALKLLQFGGVIDTVSSQLEPHRLCGYLYELATAFSAFFEHCPVLKAEDDGLKRSRLCFCDITARTLATGLELLGIHAPDRM